MTEIEFNLIFFSLFLIGVPIILGGFWSTGRIFETIRAENVDVWNDMGKPNFSFNAILKNEAKLPKNMVFIQYKWLVANPLWVGESEKLKSYFRLFRLFGFMSFIPAAGVIYLMLNMPYAK